MGADAACKPACSVRTMNEYIAITPFHLHANSLDEATRKGAATLWEQRSGGRPTYMTLVSAHRQIPHTLVLEHVSPATRLLEKRRQMFEVQEALEQQKQDYARKVPGLVQGGAGAHSMSAGHVVCTAA